MMCLRTCVSLATPHKHAAHARPTHARTQPLTCAASLTTCNIPSPHLTPLMSLLLLLSLLTPLTPYPSLLSLLSSNPSAPPSPPLPSSPLLSLLPLHSNHTFADHLEMGSVADGVASAVGRTPLIYLKSISEATGCRILGKV